ncbi:NTP transferase domain-containing protein [candidate division KSB3 bacterium]|uniref:NTP transferase domain-containing protein n=1 Tax=candidate division KSB3 bacterium TaxID=2044937 RepID=A0A9D5JXP4_9BACT|nr:NTP transferase domain-containing protein [candidate division KSB3 bacterium]MBD3326074.1 NTP transferase domain-containing protein [candidate division KSB3 bacterium]
MDSGSNTMKAIVLSAGYGTRLGDLTRETPKPMLRLHGRPLLEYIICHLARHGFDQIAINLHFLPEIIPAYFGNGSQFGVELVYSYEPELLGTAGGVKNVEGFLNDGKPFLIHYGDVITDQDFTAMLNFHQTHNALATLLLHQRIRSNSLVSLDTENRIIGFLERPTEQQRYSVNSSWTNSGIYICSPDLLNEIPERIVCDFPRDIFPRLLATHRVFGFPLSGYRCAIDSAQRLAQAHEAIAYGRCQIQGQKYALSPYE